jgi:hypothetical protein
MAQDGILGDITTEELFEMESFGVEQAHLGGRTRRRRRRCAEESIAERQGFESEQQVGLVRLSGRLHIGEPCCLSYVQPSSHVQPSALQEVETASDMHVCNRMNLRVLFAKTTRQRSPAGNELCVCVNSFTLTSPEGYAGYNYYVILKLVTLQWIVPLLTREFVASPGPMLVTAVAVF